MSDSSLLIQVNNLSKKYKHVAALHDISLQVSKGQIFGLIGPDGAGKSTLIHIMTGVLDAKHGEVKVLAKDVLTKPESIKKQIGFLPQGLGLSLAQELSVEENINFFAEINHVSKELCEQRKEVFLEATQLKQFKDRLAKNLSGGMKQKLALCCTLIHEPPLIFLDEPTTGIDPISRRDIWMLINSLVKEKGITVFATTSYMDEAARCHEVALLHKGRILERGSPDELPSKLSGEFAQISTNNLEDQQKALKALKKYSKVNLVYAMGNKINIIYQDIGLNGLKQYFAQQQINVKDVVQASPGLEDVFLSKISLEKARIDESVFAQFFKKDEQEETTEKKQRVMIETRDLEKRFNDFVAVNKISFQVKQGEIFGFLGPNGAGKTTTIKMLCGLYPPSAGKGSIAGFDLFKDQFEIRKNIGYMSQKFSLYRDLTVSENIELYGGIYGVPKQELFRRRDLILKISGLEGQYHATTGDLPMGIKQRLALGCAIIHKPACVFLDEPTSGVDPIARRQFWDIIYLLSRQMGVTILVTTHYMDEAEHCDRLSLMTKGSLVALGAPQELKDKVTREIGILLEISTEDPFKSFDVLKQYYKYSLIYVSEVHLYTNQEIQDISKIKDLLAENQIELKDIRKSVMPFEDVFVYFCEHSG